jgi:flagellar basal-body rod modification protein FlgD
MTASVNTTSSTSTSPSSSAISQVGTNALGSLSDNFSNFLSMLMTQLKNQDPTTPLDANQFTSELVQFSSVEQQINTNNSLAQLIQLTQATQVEQSASMLGKPVTYSASQIALQDGQAKVNFNTTYSEPVTISIFNASGVQVASYSTTSSAGQNSWTWDGTSSTGQTMPDGAYKITVTTSGSSGTTTSVPFTMSGTATAVVNNSGTVSLSLGSLSIPFSSVQSVGN